MSLIQMGLLALVAAILGLFVLRPILTRAPVALPGAGGFPALPGAETEAAGPALTGEIDDGDFDSLPSFGMASGDGADGGGMPGFAMAGEDPVQRLRNMIGERQEETVEILRSWLEDSGEKT